MSQPGLAKAAGISERTIARFERGEPPPLKEDSLWRIQTALADRGIEFYNGNNPGVRYFPEKALIPKGS